MSDRGPVRVHLELTIDGTIPDVERVREAVLDSLRSLTGDSTVKIKSLRRGSVIILLDLTEGGSDRLKSLVDSGELTSIQGFRILGLRTPPAESQRQVRPSELKHVFASKSLTKGHPVQVADPIPESIHEMIPAIRAAVTGEAMGVWAAVEFAPLFSGILPQDYRRISATARVKEFARGETLYLEGDALEQVYLLTSGFAKITQLGPRGTEVIVRLGVPGDVLGADSFFSTGNHSTTAQALRSGYALVWEARVFKPLVESLPVVYQNMTRLTLAQVEELVTRFRELATERVPPRFARQLIRLQEQIGRLAEGRVEIFLSREDLAQMTGTTLFTVSRLLSAWEARGLVISHRESVTICDVQSLRKISEES